MRDASLGFIRKRFMVRGNLHGSGFSAAIFRLVRSLNLRGWMRPFSRGYEIQLEADKGTLKGFESQLLSRFQQADCQFTVEVSHLDSEGDISFSLLEPEDEQSKGRWILPDTGQCPDCVSEMLNPHNRRFFYPYTYCADCGPKYSIARQGLLRREDTSFEKYPLCEQCLAEVGNSRDRRFLHTLNTCPICGPSIELLDHHGGLKSRQREALIQSAAALEEGCILAIKEISGFSLVALATVNEPVRRIRALLNQAHQPIPFIVNSVDAVDAFTLAGAREREWLKQLKAPLLRVKKREGVLSLADQIAPYGSHLDIGLPGSGHAASIIELVEPSTCSWF
jgi:hydrogenase maturation protein HypF